MSQEGLCCCEYARTSDGETRHLLQCLCECEDFDKLADECFSAVCCCCCDGDDDDDEVKKRTAALTPEERAEACAAAKTAKKLERLRTIRGLLATLDDRARVPWPWGGARRVNGGACAALVALNTLRLLVWLVPDPRPSYRSASSSAGSGGAEDSTARLGGGPWSLPWRLGVLALGGGGLVGAHLLCLRLPWRTDFFAVWVAASVWGIYCEARVAVLPELGIAERAFAYTLLALATSGFALAVLWRPPGDCGGGGAGRSDDDTEKALVGSSAEAVGQVRGVAPPLESEAYLRSYACRVCGGAPILRRDHHCVWINQCVGAHNQRPFLLFVGAFSALVLHYAWSALRVHAAAHSSYLPGPSHAGRDAAGASGSGVGVWEAVAHAVALARAWALPMPLVSAVYAAAAGCFTTALMAGQLLNISQGLTTHEQVRRERRHKSGGNGGSSVSVSGVAWRMPEADVVKRGGGLDSEFVAGAVTAPPPPPPSALPLRAENWLEWWRVTGAAQRRARWRWQ